MDAWVLAWDVALMLWSVLIAAIPERFHSAQPLLYSLLESQAVARRPEIEVLYLLDNRRRSVGDKRNALLDMARGEYVSFIDDDDAVASDYVQKVLAAIAHGRRQTPPADVISFSQRATIQPHGIIHECTYSLKHYREREPSMRRQLAPTETPNVLAWTGPPAHTMVWRKALLEGLRFPERMFGEDVSFVDAACERAATEIVIAGEPLYFYQFDQNGTATR